MATATAFHGVLRTLLGLGLCVLSFVIGRYGGHQPHGVEIGEFAAVAVAVLALTVWSWRNAPHAHGTIQLTGNILRRGLTLAGALIAAILCLAAALLGGWMAHG